MPNRWLFFFMAVPVKRLPLVILLQHFKGYYNVTSNPFLNRISFVFSHFCLFICLKYNWNLSCIFVWSDGLPFIQVQKKKTKGRKQKFFFFFNMKWKWVELLFYIPYQMQQMTVIEPLVAVRYNLMSKQSRQ